MIPINFPADPAKYNFVLNNDFGSVYLLARAVQHYGADNVNVVTPIPPPFYFSKSVHTIADILGIQNVRTVTLSGVKPDFPITSIQSTETVTPQLSATNQTLAMESLLRVFQQIEPSYTSLNEVDGGLVSNSYGGWVSGAVLSLLIDAGIVNQDLSVNTTGNYNTLVFDLSQDNGVDFLYVNFMRKIYSKWTKSFLPCQPEGPLWVPLNDYNIDQILLDAKEMNITEPLLAIHHCMHNRPTHCGICGKCTERRHLLIQADIKDTTQYSFT